jgi:hypothetical protein
MWASYPVISETALGTGFLVGVEDRTSPDGFIPVVVTTTHLLETRGKGGLAMPIRLADATGELYLTLTIVIPPNAGPDAFVRHPDLDIAAFRLQIPPDTPLPYYVALLRESDLNGTNPLRPGDPVNFSGFPEGLPTSEGMFPILRSGTVASYDQNLVDMPYFYINGDVYPGDSGAPVFEAGTKGRPRLVGMIIERMGEDNEHALPLARAVDNRGIRETISLIAHRRTKGIPGKVVTRHLRIGGRG